MGADDRTPLWRKIVITALALATLLCALVFQNRLAADFWPLDESRIGPNIIASIVQDTTVAVVLILLWPPWRRRLHHFVDRKLAPVHDHLKRQRDHNEWVARHVARIHKAQTGENAAPHPHFDLAAFAALPPETEGPHARPDSKTT